jgi:hypothetical protein
LSLHRQRAEAIAIPYPKEVRIAVLAAMLTSAAGSQGKGSALWMKRTYGTVLSVVLGEEDEGRCEGVLITTTSSDDEGKRGYQKLDARYGPYSGVTIPFHKNLRDSLKPWFCV